MNFLKISLLLLCLITLGTGIQAQEFRTIDGSENNLANNTLGKPHTDLLIQTYLDFGDDKGSPNGEDRPECRVISNEIFSQTKSIYSKSNLSDLAWVFGQFLDHDLTLVEENPLEFMLLPVPACDSIMDPNCTGRVVLPQKKSKYKKGTGVSAKKPKLFLNAVTTWIDGSNVYGSDETRTNWLRTHEGGKLKVSEHNYMPFSTIDGEVNSAEDKNAPIMDDPNNTGEKMFVAGDIRANENALLIAMHTLFVREHNRLAEELAVAHPSLDDETLFQMARERVIALIQSIVYNEWLPALGIPLESYSFYDETIDPRISNLFSASAFRVGHTMLNGHILRLEDNCSSIRQGNISIKDGYFDPINVFSTGVEPLFKGMISQAAQEVDCKVVDDVRNFLFIKTPTQSFGLDLVAFNINRGRERGVPSYLDVRASYGLSIPTRFEEITNDPELAANLQTLYGSIDKMDSWVGLLAERHIPGSSFGETLSIILKDQFRRLRNGDRFFYLNNPNLSDIEKEEISNTSISDLIKRNTELSNVQANAFYNDPVCIDEKANELASIDINIHPNPTSSFMHMSIYMKNSCDASITVFDTFGKQIHREETHMESGYNTMNMNIFEGMKNGIYFVQVNLPDGNSCTKKFTKMD